MSTVNRVKDIRDRLVAQFKWINGSGNYNFTVAADCVSRTFKPLQQVVQFPFICIDEINGSLVQTDQVTFEGSLEVTVYGYAKTTADMDQTDEADKLYADIEEAIKQDETLNSLVFNMAVKFFFIGSYENFGIVAVTFGFDTEICK